MCTISVLRPLTAAVGPDPSPRFRLVANRDELRSRAAGHPPRATEIDGLQVVMPIDPVGGGTWVAASESGLVYALLNAADDEIGRLDPPSRGAIIPSLAGSPSLADVGDRLRAGDWRMFQPWRLVATDGAHLLLARSAGGRLRLDTQPLPRAFMTTSSSFEETRASEARARLFHRIVASPHVAAQDAFHAHQWPAAPELSVRMSRPDARTVSRSVVDIGPDGISLATDWLDEPETPAMAVHLRPRRPRAGAA